MKQVWYVAHPVSGDIEGNVENVIRWIRWLTVNVPERIYIAPWVAEVQAFSRDIGAEGPDADPAFYDRVLEDDCDVVRHLDGVLLVGGRVSTGMHRESIAALESGRPVADWSGRREPPNTPTGTQALRELLLGDWRVMLDTEVFLEKHPT